MAKKQIVKRESKDAAFNIPIFTPENKTKLEDFYENNKKIITYVLSGVLIALIAFFAYKNLILKPKNQEAKELVFMAEDYFAKDSFELALYGQPEAFYGFLDILDEFSMTETANLAHYYAGICFLHIGEFEDAIKHLKKFKTNSEMLKPISLGAIGDSYSELQEYEKACSYYLKAAEAKNNKFSTPLFYMKAGKTYEEIAEYKKAIEVYNRLKEEFPKTQEGMDVEKYIGRAEAKLNSK